ncbi:MAG: hypothetical protein HOE80_03765 [Candidatus Magasanikbacteria bacterium]|nr:hypothetical protein [Candidatus Magasanikbacteria bacterium]MBT4071812.1 hypothetical protein [Candidatus Magasanikbacteria bacterium]
MSYEDTREFLINHQEKILDDFLDGQWCKMTTGFSQSAYTDSLRQADYLLRYYGMYFTSYYATYRRFLRKYEAIFSQKRLHILSIGTGSGIDFFALNRAIEDLLLENKIKRRQQYHYTGIDPVAWNYQPISTKFHFKQIDIKKLTPQDIENVDLFIFPRSLSDIERTDPLSLTRLARLVSNHTNRDRLFFINSYVVQNSLDKGKKVFGVNAFCSLIKSFTQHGWRNVNCKPQDHCGIIPKYSTLSDLPFYGIPDRLTDILGINLKDECKHKKQGAFSCNFCKEQLYIMRKLNNIAFHIHELQRDEE